MPMNGEVLCMPEFHFLKRKENGEFKLYTTHDNQPSGREKTELNLGRMNAIEIMNFLAAKLCVISPEKYIEPLVEVTDNGIVTTAVSGGTFETENTDKLDSFVMPDSLKVIETKGALNVTVEQDPDDFTPEPAYEVREVSPGWYNVFDFDGDTPLSKKNMRMKEAIAELERILKAPDGK